MWERLTLETEANCIGHIAGLCQSFDNPACSDGAIDRDRLGALQHHIDAKACEQAADMIEMMMCQDDLVDAAEIDTCTHELLHRAFTAIDQDRPLAPRDRMGRGCTVELWHRPARSAEGCKCCFQFQLELPICYPQIQALIQYEGSDISLQL